MTSVLRKAIEPVLSSRQLSLLEYGQTYPWQRGALSDGGPRASGAPQMSPAEHAQIVARCEELTRRYAATGATASMPDVWTPEFQRSEIDVSTFRGDNAFIWQNRGLETSPIAYALAYYALKAGDSLGLFETLVEDGAFGVFCHSFDDRIVSRDLLDSVAEITFMERTFGLSQWQGRSVLDIGAGYGRLAHRMLTAFPALERYLCTDAVPISTALSEFYVARRHLGERARVVALDEWQSGQDFGEITLAVNVHSFSECSLAAIESWVQLLARLEVRHVVVVPNKQDLTRRQPLTNRSQDFGHLFASAGFTLRDVCPKYPDAFVQRYGLSPAYFFVYDATRGADLTR